MDINQPQSPMGSPGNMPPQGGPEGGMQMGQPGQPQMPGGPMMPGQQPDPTQMGQPAGPQGGSPSGSDPMEALLDYAQSEANIAKRLRKDKNDEDQNVLDDIGSQVHAGIEEDDRSRQDWLDKNKEWLNLALLIREAKSWPWPKASNVKYPLVATAAMQFSARAYPALVPADGKVVKARVTGSDPQGIFEQKALRIAIFMSWQVSCQIPNWEEDMDKLLMTMAVSGIAFKKTYYDSLCGIVRSELVYPENFIVNYNAKSLEQAYRKTEILYYTDNEIKSKVLNDEQFLDLDYGTPVVEVDTAKVPMAVALQPPAADKSTPHKFYACHTYWDLDDDGYEEPYIIIIHAATKQVARITARWDSDGVKKNNKGKIAYIEPVEIFTAFPFIPNADGSIYACGFGMLMGPLNEAVNTLVNQLVDAGTLNNLSGGFIGKNLRIKMGQLRVGPGEWKVVNASGDDMHKSFYPLPTKEPSNVLMTLLNMLVTSGNQLASIAEIFVGKMPGQNTPASTTQETVQQGMAVFTAIYKRVYRSLAQEFAKIARLDRLIPDIMQIETLYTGGQQLQQSDFEDSAHLIMPGADPTGDSASTRQSKLQQLGQLLQLGTINPQVYTQRMLDALEIPNPTELIAQPQPPAPDPKAATEQLKQQGLQQKFSMEGQAKQQDMQAKQQLTDLKIQEKNMDLQYKEQLAALDLKQQAHSAHLDQISTVMQQQHDHNKAMFEQMINKLESTMALQHDAAMNAQQLQSAKQIAQVKAQKPNGSKQK